MAFLNNRLFASLKVPKSFLGYEGDVSSKGMLSQQNVTFARAIQNIQEDFLESIKDMCIIHLAIRGISDVAQLRSFDLIMTRPSYVEEKARIEVDGSLLDLGEKYKSIGANRKWIAKHVLHRTDIEIEEMFKIDPAEQQAAQAMAGGAPMAGGGGMPMDMGLGANMEAPTGQELPQEGMPQEAAGQVPMGGAPVAPAAGMVTQGNMPLTQEYRREGNLLVENFNTTSTAKNA